MVILVGVVVASVVKKMYFLQAQNSCSITQEFETETVSQNDICKDPQNMTMIQ